MVFQTLDHWHLLLSVWYMLNKNNQFAANFLLRLRKKDGLSQIYTIIYTPKKRCFTMLFCLNSSIKNLLISEEPFCFTKGSLWRKKFLLRSCVYKTYIACRCFLFYNVNGVKLACAILLKIDAIAVIYKRTHGAHIYVCPRSGEGCPLKNNDAVKLFLAVLLSNYLNLYVYLYLIGPQLKIINESTPFNLLTLLSCPCQCRIHG